MFEENRAVRQLRVLEYVGTQEWIDNGLANRAVNGSKVFPNGTITEALFTNQPILSQDVEDPDLFQVGVPGSKAGEFSRFGFCATYEEALKQKGLYPNAVLLCTFGRKDRFTTIADWDEGQAQWILRT